MWEIESNQSGIPETIRQLDPAAVRLYGVGDSSLILSGKRVAIVGTRKMSEHARQVVQWLVPIVVQAGYVVVSGLALGVDGWVHRRTLEVGGKTVAVLPTDPRYPIPRTHTQLHHDIVSSGGAVISECLDSHVQAYKFLLRNRIMAALSDWVIVVEAGKRSGALNTASHALTLGCDVAAIPADTDREQAKGTNWLLQQGAHCIWGTEAARELFVSNGILDKGQQVVSGLTAQAQSLYALLFEGPQHIDALCARLKCSAETMYPILVELELRGLIWQRSHQWQRIL